MSPFGRFQSADKTLIEWANREIEETNIHASVFAERLASSYLSLVPEENRSAPLKEVPRDGAIEDHYRIKGSNAKNVSRWLSGEHRIPWDVFDAWFAALSGKYRDGCMTAVMARFGVMPVAVPQADSDVEQDTWKRFARASRELAEVGDVLARDGCPKAFRQEAFEAMTAAAALWVMADEMERRSKPA